MIFTDTHTHLYSKEFEEDRNTLIEQAIAQGVTHFFMPNIDSDSIPALFQVEKTFPNNCFAMMGLHPCSVNGDYQKELQVVKYWLSKRKFSAIGEIGIDLYWDKTYQTQQQDAFKTQIELAQEYKLPYVIHARDSFNEVFEVVSEFKTNAPKAIFHCFGGTIEEAEKIISLGDFKLGIGGVVTFKNAGLDKVVEAIDLKHIVLETDAPYLAPMPNRGKRNNPDYLLLVAKKIAEIKNISLEEVAEVTTQNAKDVFGF